MARSERTPLAALALVGALLPASVQAGVAEFMGGCMAGIADPARLPAVLQGAGLIEIDPGNGPQGPAIAADAPGRRLWSDPRLAGRGDAFTGYAPPSAGRPFAVCWHVSRPGESAAAAMAELRRRYPPREGSVERGTEFFYGGSERWRAAGPGGDVLVGLSWPFQDRPGEGTAFLYVVRPAVAG
ncbi:hypothetical protein [Roseomonas populi]|uniref:DUF3455 domain-containing protein n=1 Tax=Roseomonas populi TaxID=3121582 RepID=A0ABT1WZD8_9PROT|nr:hypothetical protein [Roseomonas pecuniae]MCR0981194.1 hypothetical protein [Roseomonas pecuniae]